MRRKFERNEPAYAVDFFLRKLIPDQVDSLNVSVYIRKMKHQNGQCWGFSNTAKKYIIVISSDMGRTESLRSLAHEAVHVYQFVTGKMKDFYGKKNKGKVQWKTRMFDNAYEGSAYDNAPWEVEARGMQERLMRSYKRHVQKLRKSET